MSPYNLLPFGALDLNNLEEYYDAELALNGRTVTADLNFEESSVDKAKLDQVKHFLTNLDQLNKTGLQALRDDCRSGDTVKEYIAHHLEELDRNDLTALLKGANKKLPEEEQMLSVFQLKRIGFNPHNEDRFITLDYTIGEDLTDYLVVVDLTEEGRVDYITMES